MAPVPNDLGRLCCGRLPVRVAQDAAVSYRHGRSAGFLLKHAGEDLQALT